MDYFIFVIFQIYVNNRESIDPILEKVKDQLDMVTGKVSAFLPSGGAKQAAADEVKKEEWMILSQKSKFVDVFPFQYSKIRKKFFFSPPFLISNQSQGWV